MEETLYVANKDEVLIAVFNKEDEEAIINPRIREVQNGVSELTFSISQTNPKWQQISDPENLYVIKNKVFSANFEGCFTETLSENDEHLIQIKAYERQKLLDRKFVTAYNSKTGFENINDFMVVILSNGDLPLVNKEVEIVSQYEPGSSGYALDGLLYGTGWRTGVCDVEGKFDLETDQVTIYENILKVQELWGGIIVVDSLNKIIHHRDETKWLPYNGYEVKYQKNMQSLEKLYNNKIVTKLCPLGEGGLNIKSVNDGSIWLTNYSYTTSELEGIENNPDITDPEQLKRWGERKLKDLCKPRIELTVKTVLLYQVEGYELEEIALNDIVDVINFAGIDKDIEQLRVVAYEYGIWDYSDAIVELSDITLESTDIFKKTVQASNSINSGTLNSNKIIDFYKNGQSINQTFYQIDQTIIQTKSDLSKADDEIKASVETVKTNLDTLTNTVNTEIDSVEKSIEATRTELSLKDNEINAKIEEQTTILNQKVNSSEYVEKINSLSTEISATAGRVEFNFQTINTTKTELEGMINSNQQLLEEYIRFQGALIELGRIGNDFKAQLTNTELAFWEKNNKIAYISNNKLHITDAEILNKLTIGKFAYFPRDNGNLSFNWIGG